MTKHPLLTISVPVSSDSLTAADFSNCESEIIHDWSVANNIDADYIARHITSKKQYVSDSATTTLLSGETLEIRAIVTNDSRETHRYGHAFPITYRDNSPSICKINNSISSIRDITNNGEFNHDSQGEAISHFGARSIIGVSNNCNSNRMIREGTQLTASQIYQFISREVIWPIEYENLLLSFIRQLQAIPPEESERPQLWTLYIASKILRDSTKCHINPSDFSPLSDGGVGIAWNTVKSYADVEVANSGTVLFSISSDRKNLHLVSFQVAQNSIPEDLAQGVELVEKAIRND